MNIKHLAAGLLAAFLLVGCAQSQNPTIHLTRAGIGARVDATAPENGGTPALTAGAYTSTAQITPNETTGGVILTSEWDEVGADGSSVEIRDSRSTCSIHTSNVAAELGFGGGQVLHVSATGNGAPEACANALPNLAAE